MSLIKAFESIRTAGFNPRWSENKRSFTVSIYSEAHGDQDEIYHLADQCLCEASVCGYRNTDIDGAVTTFKVTE